MAYNFKEDAYYGDQHPQYVPAPISLGALPVAQGGTGATTSAAALVSLGAAASSDLRYSFYAPEQTTSGTSVSVVLQDRSTNQVELGSDVTDLTLTFPPVISGKSRDFFVRITTVSSTLTTVSFEESTSGYVEFSSETSYETGDRCVYSGVLYECTAAHTGAWNAADFAAVSPEIEIGLDDPPFKWDFIGTHLLLFTEIAPGKWMVTDRSEEAM